MSVAVVSGGLVDAVADGEDGGDGAGLLGAARLRGEQAEGREHAEGAAAREDERREEQVRVPLREAHRAQREEQEQLRELKDKHTRAGVAHSEYTAKMKELEEQLIKQVHSYHADLRAAMTATAC